MDAVNAVSETTRNTWDYVWKMPVLEFLNILCYIKDKAEHDKAEIEKWKKQNGIG